MEPKPPRTHVAQDRRAGARLGWPAAAAVIGLLALLAWGLVAGVIWLHLD